MTTDILKIPEAADGSVNQYLILNEGLRSLEAASNDFYTISLSGGNATIPVVPPQLIFYRYFMFVTEGNSVSRVLTIPQSKRMFAVRNGGSAELTVRRGTVDIAVASGQTFLFYADGSANGLVAIAGGGGGSDESYDDVTPVAGAINLSVYRSVRVINLNANVGSITLPTAEAGKAVSMLIMFKQDATGGRTVTGWPPGVKFEGGVEPDISAVADAVTSVPVLILGNGDVYVS